MIRSILQKLSGGSSKRIYRRTFTRLILAILGIFAVLGIVYFLLFNRSAIEIQQRQLLEVGEALAEHLPDSFDSNHLVLSTPGAEGELMFAARSSAAQIWLINAEGKIIESTPLPKNVYEKLKEDDNGYFQLKREWLNDAAFDRRGQTSTGDFHGLLPKGKRWITASVPLASRTGAYAGEVLLHKPLVSSDLSGFFLEKSIFTAFLVAFLVAILILLILSKNITKPIAELVRVSQAVYGGDLSARVRMPGPGRKEAPLLEEDELQNKDDDLTLLMRTMNTLIQKLQEQEQERQNFLSSISHDLRTPVTSLRGFIDAMQDGMVEPERYPYYLDIMQKECGRLQTLINSLFEVTLLDKPEQLQLAVCDINDLILQNVKGLEGVYRAKHLLIRTDFFAENLEEGKLPVLCDPERLDRVLQNILGNAIRFSPEGGELLLRTELSANGRKVIVHIEDEGPGIPEDECAKVFDRFYKVNKARGSDGSGLGLYIARGILRKHGQKIEAGRSAQLGGAMFSFTLDRPGALYAEQAE